MNREEGGDGGQRAEEDGEEDGALGPAGGGPGEGGGGWGGGGYPGVRRRWKG